MIQFTRMRPTKPASTFEKYLQEVIEEGTAYLNQYGWLNTNTGGPDLRKIPNLHDPQ